MLLIDGRRGKEGRIAEHKFLSIVARGESLPLMRVHHLLCGTLHAPPNPPIVCHGLLIEHPAGLVLVDPGIGLADGADPQTRIGQELISAVGFQFHEAHTAVRQIERMGFSPADVRHVVLTHADPDHAGALVDFPQANVQLSKEEYDCLQEGRPRYLPIQFAHRPHWHTYDGFGENWFGLPAVELELNRQSSGESSLANRILLVSLFGHTAGHCGVAIPQGDCWLLHAGDAYYLRGELFDDNFPSAAVAAAVAEDNAKRVNSLEHLRRLHREHPDQVEFFGYHDPTEFPSST